MNKLSKEKRNQLVLVGLVTAGVIVALWMAFLGPQQTTLDTLRGNIADARSRLEEMEKDAARADEIASRLGVARNRLAALENGMASGDVFAWVYNSVINFKNQYALEIPSFSQYLEEDCTLLPQFPYRQIRVTIQGRGFYHDLGRFIAAFENHFPHIRLQNLEISSGTSYPLGERDKKDEENRESLTFKVDLIALKRG